MRIDHHDTFAASALTAGRPSGSPGDLLAAISRQCLDQPGELWSALSTAARSTCACDAAGVVLGAEHFRRGQAGSAELLDDGDIAFLCERLRRTPGLVAWTPMGARRHYAASSIAENPDVGFIWIVRTHDNLPPPTTTTLQSLCLFATLLHRMEERCGEAELLLDEHRHRLGNDLQLVSSLISHQASHSDSPLVHAAMENVAERVMTLARARRATGADFAEALHHCMSGLHAQLDGSGVTLRLVVDGQMPALDERRAALAQIAVNELVTNAVKHAFVGRDGGTVTVHVHSDHGRVRIAVTDDGVPMTPGATRREGGTGLSLVTRLIAGAKGQLVTPAAGSKTFLIDLPERTVVP